MAKNKGSFLGSVFSMISKIFIFGFTIIAMVAIGQALLSPTGEQLPAEGSQFATLYGQDDSDQMLLNVNVQGIILGTPPRFDAGPFSFLGSPAATYGYAIREKLAAAADNKSIKGIFIHMATPGGTVFGSLAIYNAIKDYQAATGNPVLVYVEGVSASGGVMAMVAADKIYADQGSSVGSIGVIGPTFLYYDEPTSIDGGLLAGGVSTQGGIDQTIVSAGRSKDLGNPFRRPTTEELSILQNSVNVEYRRFVDHVSAARNLEASTIVNEMGAQIFGNQQAESYGLIDGTRSWNESIDELAKLAQLGEDFRLVTPTRPRVSFVEALFARAPETTVDTKSVDTVIRADICSAFNLPQALVYYGSREPRSCQ